MDYVLRVWVNGRLEETQTAATETPVLLRFREILMEWPQRWRTFSVTVNAEPGPFPERSWTIAKYSQ